MEQSEMICYRCDRQIPTGRAFLCISKSIEQIEHQGEKDIVQVIEAEVLITLCPSCGNRFDSDKLIELIVGGALFR